MMLYFQHVGGSKRGHIGKYELEQIRIGRSDENDLCFDLHRDSEVSAQHALITCKEDATYIEDLQSTNGTYVNGNRISEPTPLSEGDEIEFAPGGPRVIFTKKPPRQKTIQVSEDSLLADGIREFPTSKVLRNALKEAKNGSKRRIGNTTAQFMRNLMHESTIRSSKRLQLAMLCMAIIFAFVAGSLVYSNLRQRGKIGQLTKQTEKIRNASTAFDAETEKIENARVSLEKEKESLRLKGEYLELNTKITKKQLGKLQEDLGAKEQLLQQQQQQINEQAAELKRLKNLVENLGKSGLSARVTNGGDVAINLPSVLFGFNKEALSESGREKVAEISKILKTSAPDQTIVVEGHASREQGGSEAYNQRLSQLRADAVGAALVKAGTPKAKILSKGFGSSKPLASNDTEAGRSRNRRVEVIVAAKSN